LNKVCLESVNILGTLSSVKVVLPKERIKDSSK